MEKILVVDDTQYNRELLEQELGEVGYEVAVAANAQQAFAAVDRGDIDLVLLDIMMPGTSGLDVLKRLRETFSVSELPVIMVTAKHESEDVVEALEMGGNDYVAKPIDIPVLLARIRTQLRLKHLVQLKDEFLTIASHDLKGLLMKASGFAIAALRQTPPGTVMDAKTHDLVSRVAAYTREMQRLVMDFLDFQALHDRSLEMEIRPVDLNELVQRVVRNNTPTAQSKEMSLRFEPVQGEAPVQADPDRIEQVIENFVSNAVKFTFPGGSIVARTICETENVRFEVSDDGPGLTEEDMQNVFGRYSRLSSKPTGQEVSYGLGLAICRQLIDLHDGQIGVRNNPDSGATFWFALPRHKSSQATP